MNILDIIKKLCEDKGITVSQLERDLEFSRGSLYKINTSEPSAKKLQKIADYFNVSTDYLLGKEESLTSNTTSDYLSLQSIINKNPDIANSYLRRLLKNQRINNDMTEKYVSGYLGIPLESYIDFENSNNNIGVDNISKLLSLYKLDVTFIAGFLTGALQETLNTLETIQLPNDVKELYFRLMKYDKHQIVDVLRNNFSKKELKELSKLNETLKDVIKSNDE